jgi:ubiquinone/menaquinone biosynthesis C-methylase UbiE
MLLWIILVIILLLLVVLLIGFQRVTPPRRASFEGIDSPEVIQAYDLISRWPQFKVLRRMVLRELKKRRPAGVLADVGCGPGYLIALLASSFPDLHIVGVDISEEMVKAASSNFSSPGYGKRVEFRRGDVQKLPFADDTLDFVVSTLSLHHWQDPKLALNEIHRVLKPGGQFLLFDLRRDSYRLFYWLIRFAQTFVVPAPMWQVDEPRGSVLASYTPAEMERLLAEIPLAKHEVKPGFGWMFMLGRKG